MAYIQNLIVKWPVSSDIEIKRGILLAYFTGRSIERRWKTMIKPAKGVYKGTGQDYDGELIKKQRKSLVNSLVKDFYPYKFSAGQILQKKETVKARER